MRNILGVVFGLSLMASMASAAVVIEFKQVGNDIVGTATGSLTTAGATTGNGQGARPSLQAYRGQAVFGTFANNSNTGVLWITRFYSLTTNYAAPPSGGVWGDNNVEHVPLAADASGTRFGISLANNSNLYRNRIYVDSSFVHGNVLDVDSTVTYKNLTFDVLGVTAGSSYTYYLAGSGAAEQEGRRVTLKFAEVAPIPLPGGLALMAGAFGLAGVLRLRRGGGAAT